MKFFQIMDPKIFYGRKNVTQNCAIRDIPSESDDTELSDDDDTPNEELLVQAGVSSNNIEESDDEFSDEDDIPLIQLHNQAPNPADQKSGGKVTKKPKLNWKNSVTSKDEAGILFCGSELLPDGILKLDTPLKLFGHFLSEDFFTEVVRQSCLYSVQTRPNRPLCTSVEEIQRFVGMIIWMSIIKLPNTRSYWSPQTRISQVSNVMPVNRFEVIKSLLHFSDNSQSASSLDKIMPVLETIKKACLTIPLEEHLSCDEQIIPFKGRISIKTYNPKKPHKWGYKMWVLSGVSGFSYNFELFAGKRGCTIDDNEPDLGAASNVVLRLSRPIPHDKHHKIFYDNYFSSLPLISYLAKRKIHSVATVRQNRLPDYQGQTEKQMKQKGRGSINESTTKFDGIDIHAVQWYDNKIVTLISEYCGSQPVTKVKRFFRSENCRKEVDCPNIITEYNRHMGGVDLQDSLIGLYPIKLKSRKWYHRIFYHMIDVVVVNSWLLHRRIKRQQGSTEKIMPLLGFKTLLAEQLCSTGIRSSNKRGRPSGSNNGTPEPPKKSRRCLEPRPISFVQSDHISHWPEWTIERERCKLQGCKGLSRVKCQKCQVHYCCNSKNNCFLQIHQ